MNSLPKPNLDAGSVYDVCTSLYECTDTQKTLIASKDVILSEIEDYNARGDNAQFYLTEQYDGVEDEATGDQLRGLYSRMRDKSRKGRKYYDKLKSIPDNSTCPFCNQRKVKTLDHYLPQSKYPLLAVAPTNLVACCRDCNSDKRSDVPVDAASQFIHPYFDKMPPGKWLYAKVNETEPASFHYYADPPAEWPEALRERVIYHFTELDLDELYITHAGSLLSKKRPRLVKRMKASGVSAVVRWLREEQEDAEEDHPNSWETAFFDACLDSSWFINGGFIPEGKK